MKTKWKVTGAALATVGIANIVSAQIIGLGLPTIVFDPTSAADIIKDIDAIVELTKYAIDMDNVINAGAIFFTGGLKATWRGLVGQLTIQPVQNYYTETAGIDAVLNTGFGAPAAWQNASFPLNPSPTITGYPDQFANLATVDIFDAAGGNALTAIGMGSSDRLGLDNALTSLEGMVMDEGDGTNSEVEQLNLMNGGVTLGLHYNQKVDDKMSALLYLNAAMVKQQRDGLAKGVQFLSDVEGYDVVNNFGLGQCISCTVHGLLP